MSIGKIEITSFSNKTRDDKKLLKRFIDFHWEHYRQDPAYIPLFDYEYLGSRLFGIHGFFEPDNQFYRYADIVFFLARRNGETVGRCFAFTNSRHNRRWNDKVGFFGEFECVEDGEACAALIGAAETWLKEKGMDTIRGPQNLLVNEATPGILTDGFDARPIVHYHYNKPYYKDLLAGAGFKPVQNVVSWEVAVNDPMTEKLERVAKKAIERYGVVLEPWDARPYKERRREMLEVYNEAWHDNFGFVPFEEEEFFVIVDDMKMIMDKGLSMFAYVKGELAAFFGGIPNIAERMVPRRGGPRCELFRLVRMFLTVGKVKGFRLGYLGVKNKFRHIGFGGIMTWKQKLYSQKKGYEYCDIGWVLEGNREAALMAKFMNAKLTRTYTVFQKPIA
jgi:hypothetical protein